MPKRKASTSIPSNDGHDSQAEGQTTVIVPSGDLYMVFNINDAESKRLLVSRYILCLSSKVFDAMIGDSSHFREATTPTLSRDGFSEVNIDDDDFPAMSTIMNILHLRHDRVPCRISFTQLRETAMICDKYDLTRSLGLWPATWAQHYVDRIEKKGFQDWLLVASVFKRKEAFTKITRHLMLNSKIDTDTEELVTADGWPFTEGVSSTVIGTSPDITNSSACANDEQRKWRALEQQRYLNCEIAFGKDPTGSNLPRKGGVFATNMMKTNSNAVI